MSGQRERAEQSESHTCINIVILAARDQWARSCCTAPACCEGGGGGGGLRPLLLSGALMWSCTGRSAAPSPAVSAAVSCGVWAEAGGPGVQEAPAPRCSPTSSPALRRTSRRRRWAHGYEGWVSFTSQRLAAPGAVPVCWIRPYNNVYMIISGLLHNLMHHQKQLCLHSLLNTERHLTCPQRPCALPSSQAVHYTRNDKLCESC